MAPARANRRSHQPGTADAVDDVLDDEESPVSELFIDPTFGSPLLVFVEKEVPARDALVRLIKKYGGSVMTGYSAAMYLLVDAHSSSGQNLFKQYASKKTKVILDHRWAKDCVKASRLLLFADNFGGCKVSGDETIYQPPPPAEPPQEDQNRPVHPIHSIVPPSVDPIQQSYPFSVYAQPLAQRNIPTSQPQSWQATISPAQTHLQPPPPPSQPVSGPSQTHIIPRPPVPQPQPSAQSQTHYRTDTWEEYQHDDMVPQPSYDYRYSRDDQSSNWVQGSGYYEPPYEPAFAPAQFIHEATEPPAAEPSTPPPAEETEAEAPRGRKRRRTQNVPATPASALVEPRRPPARSPTPPQRIVKSTYGGNLFTAEDVMYLKKYIDYCQEQGLVLSLREICERIAIKAPHHTFYSWRRYCNKHQIRLGGYTMKHDGSQPPEDGMDGEMEPDSASRSTNGLDARPVEGTSLMPIRNRSPTPPRALFRSTTGKGVAFTQEDVAFLMKFMEYRKSQGSVDSVAFWKDVATKAPHHSRASWMKFWRRHKHELERADNDAPLPAPPEKKMRYSKKDDVLLAKHFANKPDGTSDKIFQDFGRLHPHHPWKGWQEHHRIHKSKIELLISRLAAGENIDLADGDEE